MKIGKTTAKNEKSRKGRKDDSAVPDGTQMGLRHKPSAKALGYFHCPLFSNF
jgi:hypothetical protein